MHVTTDHAAPNWLDALARLGLKPRADKPAGEPADDLPRKAIGQYTAFTETPWCHVHYLKVDGPPHMLIEVCCHGCGEGMKVAFKPPEGRQGPYPALALVREAWAAAHHGHGPTWHKYRGWYASGLRAMCPPERSRTWSLLIDDVMSGNFFAVTGETGAR